MSKMDKDDVIYGGDSAKVPVAKVNWTAVQSAVEQAVADDLARRGSSVRSTSQIGDALAALASG